MHSADRPIDDAGLIGPAPAGWQFGVGGGCRDGRYGVYLLPNTRMPDHIARWELWVAGPAVYVLDSKLLSDEVRFDGDKLNVLRVDDSGD
jgi:hypothetical protein